MEFNVEDPVRRPRRLRTVAILFVVAVLVCSALAAITVFASVTAALIAGIAFLWVGLLAAIRQARAEARRVDIFLEQAKDKYDSIIGVLCGSLHLKDDINVNHTSRVSRLASMVAEEMGMRGDEVRLLQKAAILADIGKIEIAQGIITKPGELSEQEWREMKRHPEYGYQILSSIVHLRDARDLVLSHHERFDGQGYPRGLKGEEIPLGARIFSVADAYCAMTSDRPHRKKMPHEMALKEILRNSLTQFDPEVVRAFVRCEERGLINEWHGAEAAPANMATGVPSPA
jgi:HD-GYP domain-containing protein (c-di-GMP phosphodiesterase class II)